MKEYKDVDGYMEGIDNMVENNTTGEYQCLINY